MELPINQIMNGNCLQHLKELPDNSVDAIITDPPYGLSFMNKHWDYDVPSVEIWKECLRVLKHGGHLLSFAGTRTYHRMTCNVEDAGFEIRDMISWIYGSGFPKSLNIGKQIDKINGKKQEDFIALGNYLKEQRTKFNLPQIEISKHFPSKTGGITGCVSNWELGMNVPTKEQWTILKEKLQLNGKFDWIIEREEAEREVIRKDGRNAKKSMFGIGIQEEWDITSPNLPEAKQWDGWGTSLKPACEPIVVARKPLSEKNVALNVLKWGTGGINIDECKIGTDEDLTRDCLGWASAENEGYKRPFMKNAKKEVFGSLSGRFPANVILDEEAGEMLDKQSGISQSKQSEMGRESDDSPIFGTGDLNFKSMKGHNNCGGASRFFYCAKASKSERNLGLGGFEEATNQDRIGGTGQNNSHVRPDGSIRKPVLHKNNHPTVKPIKLMEYLIKLVTKEGAIVLDPFLGSGTTAIACLKLNRLWIGIEREKDYIKIAEARIKHYSQQSKLNNGGEI